MLGKVVHESQMPLSLVTHGKKSLVLIPAYLPQGGYFYPLVIFGLVFYLNFHQNVLIFLLAKAVKN